MEYKVPLYAQTQGMSCWAASIAMILAWASGGSYTDSQIAENTGGVNYQPSMTGNGLDPSDKYILQRNGFELISPLSYSKTYIKSLLSEFGPLWVATKTPGVGAHIRVITGVQGSKFKINDPWPVNVGQKYKKSYNELFKQMENLMVEELDKHAAPVYLAYLLYPVTLGADDQSYL